MGSPKKFENSRASGRKCIRISSIFAAVFGEGTIIRRQSKTPNSITKNY